MLDTQSPQGPQGLRIQVWQCGEPHLLTESGLAAPPSQKLSGICGASYSLENCWRAPPTWWVRFRSVRVMVQATVLVWEPSPQDLEQGDQGRVTHTRGKSEPPAALFSDSAR